MPNTVWVVLGVAGFMLLLDLIIVRALIAAGWQIIGRGRGSAEIAPDAVRRNFQSFGFGIFNFGMCVHVVADERYLHLLPSWFLRWAGARPVSIGWDEIEVTMVGRRWAKARIGTTKIRGPAWALRLAERGEAPFPEGPARASKEGEIPLD